MNPSYFRLLAAGAALLALPACHQTDDVPPALGTLKGYASKWQVASITASSGPNQAFTVAPADSDAYYIHDLPPGTYTVTFQPAACYAQPAPQTLTVLPNVTTEIAEPVLHSRNGQLSWQTVWMWPSRTTAPFDLRAGCMQASAQAGTLDIKAFDSNSAGASFSIELQLPGFANAPGSFSLGPNAAARLVYNGSATPLPQWSTQAAGGSGVVTITAVGTNPRRVSGTFSADLQPVAGNARDRLLIQNGTFTDVLY